MILLFQGARVVIKADQLLRQQGLSSTIIPVPEQYSSECGMCIRINPTQKNSIIELLDNAILKYTIKDETN